MTGFALRLRAAVGAIEAWLAAIPDAGASQALWVDLIASWAAYNRRLARVVKRAAGGILGSTIADRLHLGATALLWEGGL